MQMERKLGLIELYEMIVLHKTSYFVLCLMILSEMYELNMFLGFSYMKKKLCEKMNSICFKSSP